MKHNLKSITIGFEIPGNSFNLDKEQLRDDFKKLISVIVKSYPPQTEVLDTSMRVIRLEKSDNDLLVYLLIVRYNSELLPLGFMKDEFNEFKTAVSNLISEYLTSRKMYHIIVD